MPLPQPCERGWGPKSGSRGVAEVRKKARAYARKVPNLATSVRGLRLVGHLHPEGHLAEALPLGEQLEEVGPRGGDREGQAEMQEGSPAAGAVDRVRCHGDRAGAPTPVDRPS